MCPAGTVGMTRALSLSRFRHILRQVLRSLAGSKGIVFSLRRRSRRHSRRLFALIFLRWAIFPATLAEAHAIKSDGL